MADRLTLKGVKVVTNHTGSNLELIQAKRGDTHPFKQWWALKNTVQYNSCTIFDVHRAAGDLRLVIPSTMNTRLEIEYDGADTFTFGNHWLDINRVGVVGDDGTVYVEYVFPSQPGNPIKKNVFKPLPTVGNIGNITVTGNTTPLVDTEATYNASHDGNTSNPVTYVYRTSPTTSTISGRFITFNESDNYVVTATGYSDGASDDGVAVGALNVTARDPAPDVTLGTVTVSGSDTAVVDQQSVYGVSISGDAVSLTYLWDAPGIGGTIVSGQGTPDVVVAFNQAGDQDVICTVTASDIHISGPTTGNDTLTVTVS